MEKSFVVGDEIYHKSLNTQKWVIEIVDETKVCCSTLKKDNLEKKVEWFSIDSISKIDKSPSIRYGSNPKRNNYW